MVILHNEPDFKLFEFKLRFFKFCAIMFDVVERKLKHRFTGVCSGLVLKL
jgi:hypothetical protein